MSVGSADGIEHHPNIQDQAPDLYRATDLAKAGPDTVRCAAGDVPALVRPCGTLNPIAVPCLCNPMGGALAPAGAPGAVRVEETLMLRCEAGAVINAEGEGNAPHYRGAERDGAGLYSDQQQPQPPSSMPLSSSSGKPRQGAGQSDAGPGQQDLEWMARATSACWIT